MKLGAIIRKEFLQFVFVFLSFGLMVFVSYLFVSRIVENQIFSNAQEALQTGEAAIRSDLREAEVALLHAELLIKQWDKEGKPAEVIQSYMAMVTGTLGLEDTRVPGYVDMYGYVHNSFVSGLGWDPPQTYNPKHRYWYMAAETANGGVGLTSPYLDVDTGKYIVSIAKNLKNEEGESYGTIALDIDLSPLSAYIKSIHFTDGGYGMLCDENFHFITHPAVSYVGLHMDETALGHDKIAQKLRKNPDAIAVERMVNKDNVPVMIIFRQIYNGWYLGIATPVSSYYHGVRTMALVLSVLGSVFMVILCIILIRLNISKARSDEENTEKSSFLARMSHEIRTPMNSILGMAEVIQRKLGPGEVQEYIEIIRQSGNNLLSIINDILDLSKIESGRLQIENREYHIASVINDMVNIVRPRIAEKPLDFFVNVDSSIPATLYGDDMRLRQILTNLLSNAIKYTPKGFISLDLGIEWASNINLKLICEVQDSGIGIKPEDQQQLFSEFSRVDIKSTRGIEGTGLGLVITKLLCRAMEGDVTITSEYGKGSTFRAVIAQKCTDGTPVAQVTEAGKKRVLFYDWRALHVLHLSRMFKNLGVNAECATDFREFLGGLERGGYDYAFVSSKHAMDCINAVGRRDSPLQLVTMVEPREMAVYREVTKVLLPVYSIAVANVLNDTNESSLLQDKAFRNLFTAPAAKILIVDDIPTNLRVAKELMASYRMDIQTCLSGPEAIDLIAHNRFDLVFMDHMMPGMDGLETTDRIRAMECGDGYCRKLPVIALTANALSGQRELFLQHKLNDFLAKPIDINKLNAILEKWLPAEKRQEAAEPEADTRAEKTEFAAIPGVDAETGLRNSGGNTAAYMSILADFCNDAEARLVQIDGALEKGEMKLYVTLVHALKGAARSVGATETGELAWWLEKNAGADSALVAEKTAGLRNDVLALIGGIRNAVARYDAENSREHIELSAEQLDTLKTALAKMNIKAVNKTLMDFAGLPLDEKTKSKISEVEQCILLFEYEKAIEKINGLFMQPHQ